MNLTSSQPLQSSLQLSNFVLAIALFSLTIQPINPRSPSRSTFPTTLAQYFDPNPQSNRIKIFSPLYLIPSSNSLFYSVISITCMPLNNTRGRREKAAADRDLPHIPFSPLIRHKPCSWQKNKLINHLLRIYVLFWGSPLRMAFDPA